MPLDESFRELLQEQLTPILKELKEIKTALLNVSINDRISFSLKEASVLSGISYESLYRFYRNGQLPGKQVAGQRGAIIILREDLVNLIVSRAGESFSLSDIQIKFKKKRT